MKLYKLRLMTLISTFFFLIISIVILYTCFYNRIWHGEVPDKEDQATQLLFKIIGVYAVHIAVMLTSYFGSKPLSRIANVTESYWVAFSLIILWHLGFVSFLYFNGIYINVSIFFSKFDSNFGKFVISINFLIAGALVFLFKDNDD